MGLIEYSCDRQGLVAGLDEAGRGCLAGPVVAAAVILPPGFEDPILDDSKKLSEAQRDLIRHRIEREAVSYAVAYVYPARIDKINILWASIEAMHVAVGNLKRKPSHLIVDGNRFKPYKDCTHECIVKGDGRFFSIAAASVLAKTYRDEYMKLQHAFFPDYGWDKNKGYPTREHRLGINSRGSCVLHRKSFRLLPDQQMEIF